MSTTDDEIKNAETMDLYFKRTKEILEKEGDMRKLLMPLLSKGRLASALPSVDNIRKTGLDQLDRLHASRQ